MAGCLGTVYSLYLDKRGEARLSGAEEYEPDDGEDQDRQSD